MAYDLQGFVTDKRDVEGQTQEEGGINCSLNNLLNNKVTRQLLTSLVMYTHDWPIIIIIIIIIAAAALVTLKQKHVWCREKKRCVRYSSGNEHRM